MQADIKTQTVIPSIAGYAGNERKTAANASKATGRRIRKEASRKQAPCSGWLSQ